MDNATRVDRINECLSSVYQLSKLCESHALGEYHLRNAVRILELLSQEEVNNSHMREIRRELERIKRPTFGTLAFSFFVTFSAVAFWVDILLGWAYG